MLIKDSVNWSMCVPWRHIGESMYGFTHSLPWHKMELSG